jgi:hypothetical protein
VFDHERNLILLLRPDRNLGARRIQIEPPRTAASTIKCLDRVVEEMPFATQHIQTDWVGEFFAERVPRWLANYAIKFRPLPPCSPHLSSKVDRSQLTDLQEFWTCLVARHPQIALRIEEWQFDYNWRRAPGSLRGKAPVERARECKDMTPLHEDVANQYEPLRERLRHRDYRTDEKLTAHSLACNLRLAIVAIAVESLAAIEACEQVFLASTASRQTALLLSGS